jgi:hypothetical protein
VHSLFKDQNQGYDPPDVFSFWVVSDIFEENNLSNTSAFAGAMGMMLRQRDARKPSFNAFKMMHMLGDTLIPMTGGVAQTQDKGLNGIATYNAAKNQAQVLIYDHTYGSGTNPTFTTGQDNVKLTLSNLPFGNGQIKVERYGVDKTHSNCFTTWVNQGRPAKPTTQQWDQIEADGKLKMIDSAYSVPFTGAAFTKDFTQSQPGVSLFVLTGASPVGAARPHLQPPHEGIVLEADARNGFLELAYALPRRMPVTLLVMNAEGRLASKAVSEAAQPAGSYRVKLETLAPGRYFCMLRSGETVVQTAAIAVGR